MGYLMIIHEVEEFNSWKKAYDDHADMREKATIKELYLLHNINKANEVVILFEYQDENKAKDFMNSDDLKQAMQKAGVVGKPDIKMLEKASAR